MAGLQLLVDDFEVDLAPSSSQSFFHQLHLSVGTKLVPNYVMPDRATPIFVDAGSINDTTITFINTTGVSQKAAFHVEHRHTIVEGDDPPILWQGLVAMDTGGDLEVFADSTGGNDANPGTALLPVQTIGRALRLLYGTAVDSGRRILHLAIGPNNTVGFYPATTTGSFGTPGIFGWGNAGPLGLDAEPFLIESDFIPFDPNLVGIVPTGVALNVVSFLTPINLGQDDLEGAYLQDANGIRYTVIGNTAALVGGNTDVSLQVIPGQSHFPLIVSPISIVRPGAQIQLPADGEYTFQQMAVGLKGIEFLCTSSGGFGTGSTLSFRACRVWAQGVWITLPDESEINLQANTTIECNPEDVSDVWALDPNTPFSPDSFAGISIFSPSGQGDIQINAGCKLNGPIVQKGGSYVIEQDGCADLRNPWFSPVSEFAIIGGKLNTRPAGTFFGLINAGLLIGERDDSTFRQLNLGNAGYKGKFCEATFLGVGNVAALPIADYGIAVDEIGKARVDAATTVTGGINDTLIGTTPKAYVALPFADADTNVIVKIP